MSRYVTIFITILSTGIIYVRCGLFRAPPYFIDKMQMFFLYRLKVWIIYFANTVFFKFILEDSVEILNQNY